MLGFFCTFVGCLVCADGHPYSFPWWSASLHIFLHIFTYSLSFKMSLHIFLRYRNFLKNCMCDYQIFSSKKHFKIFNISCVYVYMWMCVCAYIYVYMHCMHVCIHACICGGQRLISEVFLDYLYLIYWDEPRVHWFNYSNLFCLCFSCTRIMSQSSQLLGISVGAGIWTQISCLHDLCLAHEPSLRLPTCTFLNSLS